jgi:glycosyltransferase involved in cell wall biosynthesis
MTDMNAQATTKATTKKVNVLQFICPTGFYGAERWVLAIANNLDPSTARCDLAVTEESPNQNLEIVTQYPEVEGKAFKISMKSRFDLAGIQKLCDLIRERDIDVIHTHGYKSDILGLIAAKRSGIKCVSTPHGFGEPSSWKLKQFIRLGKFCLRFCDKVVPLSQQLMDECIDAGVPKRKLQYVQNGVDLKEVEAFRASKSNEQKAPDDARIIGFIGQMIPRKKVDQILEIFDRLCRKHPNITLQLLGDGESRKELEEQASKLDCKANIEFLGFRNDRLERLKNFDLFVMSSSDEGIPRCLMEAMAMETPVSAYNIPGIDQLLEHQKTALLAPYGDKETLLEQWETLLYDNALATKLAQESRSFVLEHFSAERMSREYMDIFNSLLNK